jgi:hypothetical protein
MKRLLICLVALIAVFALVMPASAAEMKVNGLFNAKAWAIDNYNGDDDNDDSTQYVTQRFRSYWEWTQSENLKLVYRNEIDMEWGDSARGQANRNDGGAAGGDTVNLETKNIFLQFMVPDTPVKATLGLQGVTLHKGWFISDDVAGARFDMNFDPVSITAYWVGLGGLYDNDAGPGGASNYSSSNDQWSVVASGAYKAENMDARLTFGYQRNPNDSTTTDNPKDDDLYLVMCEFNMSFDMMSFFVIAAKNFGEADGNGGSSATNRNYDGYMFNVGANFALDMSNLTAEFIYASGDKEGDFDDDFQGFVGETYSWAEIISDGYTYDRNADLAQIGGDNSPSNMWAVHVGGDLKPTDTTTLRADVYYVGMVEKRTVAGDKEDEIGTEIDVRLIQKIYDNLSLTVLGCYLIADDGYGVYAGSDPADQASGSGDDAFQVGMGIDFKF